MRIGPFVILLVPKFFSDRRLLSEKEPCFLDSIQPSAIQGYEKASVIQGHNYVQYETVQVSSSAGTKGYSTLPCSESHENIQISVDGNSCIFSIPRKFHNTDLNICLKFQENISHKN